MKKLATTFALSALSSASFAALTPPPEESKPFIDLRYRFENVQDDTGTREDADASTIRLRFGAQTKEFAGFSGRFAFEEVNAVGGDENYNSGNSNADQQGNENDEFAGVADPTKDSLDEAYIQYRWEDIYIRAGRQYIQEANARLIGAASWRQSQQTFDAARITYQGLENTQFDLAFIDNTINVRSEDSDIEGTYFHASTEVGPGKLRLQYLDVDDLDDNINDRSTILVGYTGSYELNDNFDLLYMLELGQQTDSGDNATDISADYSRFEIGAGYNSLYAKVGMEILGEDEDALVSFQTPLAANFGHNGWADVFLVETPSTGLADTYLALGAKYEDGLAWKLRYHSFTPDGDTGDYGTEIDYLVTYQVNDPWQIGFRYANYMADNNGADGERFNNDLQKASLFTTVKF